MTRPIYPFDPHGSDVACYIPNESKSLPAGKLKVIFPVAAPFFLKDFRIKEGSTTLKEGVDFYFGHRYLKGSHLSAQRISGSIWITNPKLKGPFQLQYRTVGGMYTVSAEQIAAYLPKMVDPTNEYWEDVLGEDLFYPPVAPAYDRDAFIAEPQLIETLDDMRDAIAAKDPTKGESHKLAVALIANLEKIVSDSQWAAHKANESVPHHEQHHNAGALHEAGIAQNAAKAYNKTKPELRDAVLAETDLSAETSKLFPRNANRTVTGDIVLADGEAHIAAVYGTDKVPVVDLSSGNSQMVATKDLQVQADVDRVGGKRIILKSGANQLTIDSSGQGFDNKVVKYNDQEVLTTETLAAYASSASGSGPTALVYRDGPNLDLSGSGTAKDPLKATVVMPDAGAGSPGLATLEQTGRNVSGPFGVSQKAITAQRNIILSLVPVTRKINGIALDNDIVLTKANIGLDKVANLSDVDMPANSQHSDLLVDVKAMVGHTHEAKDITITSATLNAKGVVRHSDAIDSNDKTLASNTDAAKRVIDAAKQLEDEAGKYVPEDLMQLSRYGKFSYLPVPVLGNYPASGIGTSYMVVGEREADGDFVILRNGMDDLEQGVFYSSIRMDPNGRPVKLIPTTARYNPPGLKAGEKVLAVKRGSEGVFILQTSGGYYLVFTRGTMDQSKHHLVKILNAGDFGHQHYPLITGDRIVIILPNYSNGGCNVSALVAPYQGILDVTEITLTQLLMSGNDVFGTPQTNVATFTMVGNGMGPNASHKGMSYNADGFWTTVNIRHAECNYDVVGEGAKIRVNFYNTSYCANSFTSRHDRWNASFVLDLDARTAVMDRPDIYPLKVSQAGVDHNSRGNRSIVGGEANNTAGVLRSRGTRMWYYFYGTNVVPGIGLQERSIAGELSEFDYLDCRQIGFDQVGTTMANVGNYGSSLGNNMRFWHEVGGNKAIVQDNARLSLFEYVPGGSFGPGFDGLGPTQNRVQLSWSDYIKYRAIPYTYDNGTEYGEGFVFHDGQLSGKSKMVHGANFGVATFTDDVSLPAALFNALKDQLRGIALASIDPAYFINDKMSLVMHKIAGLPMVGTYAVRHYTSASKTQSSTLHVNFTFTLDRKVGTIGAVTFGQEIHRWIHANGNAVELNNVSDGGQGSSIAKLDDGKWLFIMAQGPYTTWVGYGGTGGFRVIYDPVAKAWQNPTGVNYYHNVASGLGYNKTFGQFNAKSTATGESILADVYGKTQAAIVAGNTTQKVLQMSRMAEGWVVYFTEQVPGILNGNQWQFPSKGYDLKALFPSNYQNNTFYIYASVRTGSADYDISVVVDADQPDRVLIGTCKTDSSRIIELRVDGLTRLGKFRELDDHMASRHVHGIEGKTKEDLGYGLVENKEPRYELTSVGFEDVFNNWYRFSHMVNNWTQPASPTELNAWVYDAGTDRIKCTVNSNSNIGFVSDVAVGDFVFDVEVGVDANSPDGDNDAITLVIAFKSTNGKEQTITIVRAASIENHLRVPTMLAAVYDYQLPDHKIITSVETNEVKGTAWKGRFSRIVVTRVGDRIDVKATNIEARSWASATDADFVHTMSFTLNDIPELAIFKGENRFGYGAVSQNTATYKAYVRPDADDRNYYATHAAALKALAWHKDIRIFNGTAIHGSTLPLPTGASASEVMYFISPRRRIIGNGAHALSEITRMNYAINQSTRVVTASCSYTYAGVTYTDSMEVSYYGVVIPGGKFFK